MSAIPPHISFYVDDIINEVEAVMDEIWPLDENQEAKYVLVEMRERWIGIGVACVGIVQEAHRRWESS